jgi:hypothetical protein
MSYKLIVERWNRFVNEAEENKKKIFVLVGPPSVGKSTWIQNTFAEEPYTINRDDLVEQVAEGFGWTYDDLFVAPPQGSEEGEEDPKYGQVVKSPSFMTWQPLSYDKVLQANNQVQSLFMDRVSSAVPSGKDIVVDMTNMNANARKAALNAIKGSEELYEKIAVVFQFEGAEETIKAVAQKRAEAAKRTGKSKTIPAAAFDRMFKAFQAVSKDEGFDQIVSVDNREMLSKITN